MIYCLLKIAKKLSTENSQKSCLLKITENVVYRRWQIILSAKMGNNAVKISVKNTGNLLMQ